MATSGSYNFTTTRNDIIQAAFRKIGALGDYETIVDSAAANRLSAGIAALNPMIKALANKGMPLWAITEELVALSNFATSGFKTIGPGGTISLSYKPLKLIQALRRDTSVDRDVPMNIYTHDQFRMLPTTEETGTPVHVHYQPNAYLGQLEVWTLPDTYWQTNGTMLLRFQRQFQDFDASTDEPDFPTEWHEAIIYQLAVRLAPEYGLAANDRKSLKDEADLALADALSFGTEEGSLFLQPARRWGR